MMQIETVDIADLQPDPKNARKHDETNLKAIKASLSEFGQRKPIVITSKNVVVAGNGTLAAARSLGWDAIDAVRVPADWTANQIKAFALADNRTAELADWDRDILSTQLVELQTDGWDISLIGFDVTDLPTKPADENDDIIPEPPAEPISKLGDVWQLGRHRLMCGDSSHKSTLDKLMNGQKAKIVYTDPPYGMNLDTDYTQMGSNRSYDSVIGDDKQFDARFLLDYFGYCKEIFLWGADYYVETLNRKYPNLGSWLVWDKYSDQERAGLLDGRFGSGFETVWSKAKHARQLVRILVKTNYTSRGDETRVHPTQKPVELAAWFINKFTKAKDLLVDIYGGSGSTLIACEQTDRTCFMMELDPKYVDVIIKRWETLTGQTAVLQDN
jgi:site-specific DNA-methyltransferase (adenine-specific)